MAIARRTGAISSVGFVTTNAVVLAAPPNQTQFDLMLVAIQSQSSPGTWTLPTGWSQSQLGNVSVGTLWLSLFWKVVTASEPGTYSFQCTNNITGNAVIAEWQATDTVVPMDVAMTSATGTTSPNPCPAITPVTNNVFIVSVLGCTNAISGWTAPVTAPTTNSFVEESPSNGSVQIFDQGPVTGAQSARSFTPGGTTSNRIGVSIALRPATAAPSGQHIVTGSGSFAIATPVAVSVTLTSIPSGIGTAKGNPTRYFNLGNIAWATPNGAIRQHFLSLATELVIAPMSDATTMYYSLVPGMTATIQELSAP